MFSSDEMEASSSMCISWKKSHRDDNPDADDLESDFMNMAKVGPSEFGSTISAGGQSLHFDDRAINVEEQGHGYFDNYSLVNQEIRFMQTKIRRRECKCFIEVPNQDPSLQDDEKECGCGYTRGEHSDIAKRQAKSGGVVWNHTEHTRTLPTNAFGEIEFVGYGDKVGKYVRVDVDTPMENMLALLQRAWGMEKPNLLISVTGGAKNFTMKTRLREVFRRGLMKAALSTGAWIVTGGTNAGVMKHVGEAVRDYGLTSEGRVMTIGIAPWGCVQNKEHLTCDESEKNQGKWPASYRIESEVKKKQSFLDPNHSHFILVDNGSYRKFTVEIPFRAKLEEAIGSEKTDTGEQAVAVPVCLLVLEGGPGTLQTVHSALNSNTPTVVIKGSGKTADILAYAYQNAREEEIPAADQKGNEVKTTRTVLDPHVLSEITEMIKTHFGEANLATRVIWVKDCVRNLDLMSVFELDSKNSAKDVDLAILEALLKANKNQVMDQLKLALAWNRIDVAKSEIFTDERRWPTGMLDDVMLSAIQLNRVDFVELFLDHGVSLKNFLTVKRLIILYNSIPKTCLLYTLLTKTREKNIQGRKKSKWFSLVDVGYLIQDLVGDFYQPHYLTDKCLSSINVDVLFGDKDANTTIEKGLTAQMDLSMLASGTHVDQCKSAETMEMAHPTQELFMWSVLMNYHKLSLLFWKEGRDSSTAAALFANGVLNGLSNYTHDAEVKRRLHASANDYASLAVGVINRCYTSDEKRTHDLLIHDMPSWGKSTCIVLAAHSDNKHFISQTACMSLFHRIWMGRMCGETKLWKIILCTLLFPFIGFAIKFTEGKGKTPKEIAAAAEKSKEKDKKAEATHDAPALLRQQTTFHMETASPPSRTNTISPMKKLVLFYKSPVVKFILNVMTYSIFLVLYSYLLVVQLSSDFHFLEGIIIAWVGTIFGEEIRQFMTGYSFSMKSKFTSYFQDSWNVLDIVTIALFILGMALRFVDGDDYLSAARVILSVNLITFFSRILHIFSMSKALGPKLVMINRMIRDLMSFVVILLVFIVSYAIASEAVLYPNSELNWKLFFYLPRKAYWHIYGELFLEDIEGENSCTNDPLIYNTYSELRCPSEVGKYFVPILLGLYILMTNVLLLNLLIAMFSYTFQQVQDNTDMHWCFQKFNLVYEYTNRPVLPPPFIIFSHLSILLDCCFQKCSLTKQASDKFRKIFSSKLEEKQLMQWENVIADNYLNSREKTERNSLEGRVKSTTERLDTVLARVDELHESRGLPSHSIQGLIDPALTPSIPAAVTQRIDSLENQQMHTSKALEWIMKSLEEHKLASSSAKPVLPDLQKKKEDRKSKKDRKKKAKEEREKQLVKDLMEKKIESHYKSRISPYPGTNTIMRFPVPDEKVLWEIDYLGYNPPTYTSVEILRKPPYADDDLLALTPDMRKQAIQFNQKDDKCRISRESFGRPYEVVDGLPVNPVGRTGLRGRGSLGRWGPNHAGDPVVTRWKMLKDGTCAQQDGKPVLEFIAVQRLDNNMWALPGGMCGPGEKPWDVLHTDFKEDTQGDLLDDPVQCKKIQERLDELSITGKEVYMGYADDPRNTDNAWIETRVVNYHDHDGTILKHHTLRASEDVTLVSWQTISSTLSLHGAHAHFVKLVADEHGAAF